MPETTVNPVIIDPFSGTDYLAGTSSKLKVLCSFFQHGVTDVDPLNWRGTWPGFLRGVWRTFDCDRGLPPTRAKLTLPSACGATFREGSTRNRDGVGYVGLWLADFDNGISEETGEVYLDPHGRPTNRPVLRKVRLATPVTLDMVAESLHAHGITGAIWTTWSSTEDWPRFRVAIPLASPIPGDFWSSAVDYGIDALGWRQMLPAIDLSVVRNPSALGLMPGAPDPSQIQRIFIDGDALLIPQAQLSKTAPIRSELSSWQRHTLRTINAVPGPRWWEAYLASGNVQDYRDLDLVSVLRSLGCWVGQPKSHGNGIKVRCTCPWHSEHSGGIDDDAAVIFMGNDRWPGWHCSHASHRHLGLRDILEAAWGRP